MAVELYTIGHSDLTIETFIGMIERYDIATVADVRSVPYSRFNPGFNRGTLARNLDRRAISYVFLGEGLGARGGDFPEATGAARYALIASSERFARGLDRLRAIMVESKTALLCAERDPLACHRTLLVCRALRSPGIAIRHILGNGSIEDHEAAEHRMMERAGLSLPDLFDTPGEVLDRAYDILADRPSGRAMRSEAGAEPSVEDTTGPDGEESG